jgi:hypothetical protein
MAGRRDRRDAVIGYRVGKETTEKETRVQRKGQRQRQRQDKTNVKQRLRASVRVRARVRMRVRVRVSKRLSDLNDKASRERKGTRQNKTRQDKDKTSQANRRCVRNTLQMKKYVATEEIRCN